MTMLLRSSKVEIKKVEYVGHILTILNIRLSDPRARGEDVDLMT